MTCIRWFLLGALLLCLHRPAHAGDAAKPALSFERDVRPIFKAHCFHCHGESPKLKARLDLRLVRTMRAGGQSGEAVVPGNHEESLLWERIDADEMPPGEKKLSASEKALITSWIDQGASTSRPEPESLAPGAVFSEEERSFWSFQPIRRPDVPAVAHAELVRTPIDAFLLKQLEAKGLSFSSEADKRTLIRRATLDLTGLPPTLEEIDTFLADTAPDAYDRLIDRLLASPQYGERWGRHWLDLAGYADSDGYTPKDAERKYAYKYRDYIIRSFNADRPWNELIVEQLAGDELITGHAPNLAPAELDKLIATGFLRMAPDGTSDPTGDQVIVRNDVVAETIKIVSSSLLGLTVGCAQCHSHRYDPIAHEDYYRLRALFEPALDCKNWRTPNARLISLWTEADKAKAQEVDAQVKAINRERAADIEALVQEVLERELADAPADLQEKLKEARETPKAKRTEEQNELLKEYPRINVSAGNVSLYDAKAHREIIARFDKLLKEAQAQRPPDNYVQALTEIPGQVPATFLFQRGDPHQPAQEVAPGELSILASAAGTPEIPVDDPAIPTSGRRLAYAKHLTSGKHSLVARVLVNQVWLHHFGKGLVNTPADFGALGERPSHPELLDWLADDFMRGGWTLKRMHKLIMTSTAYRQSSRRTEALDTVDPENRLLGRMSVRRLEAESLRDAILATSGRLNRKMFGPPVPVAPDETGQIIIGVDNRDGAGRPVGKRAELGGEELRRSVYIQVRRSMPLGMLESFDAPAMAPNCDRRACSTVAPQSLLLMNNEFIIEQSAAFADRVARQAGDQTEGQVRLAWQLALATEPTADQVKSAVEFLDAQRTEFAAKSAEPADKAKGKKTPPPEPARQALASFCQALLSSNAFLYVD